MANIQSCFKRYEKKYCLTLAQQQAILQEMQPYMKKDAYGQYTICNLYYDTDDWRLIRTSLEKPLYKEKLRVRSYGTPAPDGNVFVEIKKKYDGVVYKRRITARADEADFLVSGFCPAGQLGQIGREIQWFRSMPGTAREIAVIFIGMTIGLAAGMGFVVLAVLTFVLLGGMLMLLSLLGFGQKGGDVRTLKIVIPENLDYDGLFDDILTQYTQSSELVRVKTSNMGTLYELEYAITLPGSTVPKAFLDELRCRNGNLNITCSRETTREAVL